MIKYYILLILSILLGAVGQLFIKLAAVSLKNPKFSLDFILNLIKSYNIWIAVACYGSSFLMWVIVLTKIQLSFARPMVSLGYLVTATFSVIILKEKLNFYNWIGIVLIVAGVILMSMKGIKIK